MAGPAGAPAVQKPAVGGHLIAHEGERRAGRIQPCRLAEDLAGMGQGCDHQAVPIGQYLVIPAGADASVALIQENGAGCRKPGLGGGVGEGGVRAAIEDGVAFPIAARGHVVMLLENL